MLKQRPDLTPVCLLCLVVSKQKPANRLLIFVSRFFITIVRATNKISLFRFVVKAKPNKHLGDDGGADRWVIDLAIRTRSDISFY